ncbi:MAG: tRNA (adenosine(37)-N6)-threonylcarbamoyltransferase complex dimerization subunit type 1 TsaB, partial [Bacteroidales bacterium]|nr:tRNA (adenosine(37)-N6)-threonylcarbamoyltransferase complex dimerization subunit type 1 TsaB [Bacteroidales bacterium]
MPLILNVDTSTRICSVALASEGILLDIRESHEDKSHSRQLSIFINDLLKENNIDASALDAVAVSMGPGSYTGLRIGVSTAKGLAYGGNFPLIGIGTLDSLVSGALQNKEIVSILEKNDSTLLCPMIDARRMEVYTALYSPTGTRMEDVSARIIDESSFFEKLEIRSIVFLGNGSGKCREKIIHPNAFFVTGIETSAEHMIPLAEKSWQQKKFEDLAYFEPLYLKDFIATIPKNKIIPGRR